MKKPLTKAQQAALTAVRDCPGRSADWLGKRVSVLRALQDAGLVRAQIREPFRPNRPDRTGLVWFAIEDVTP